MALSVSLAHLMFILCEWEKCKKESKWWIQQQTKKCELQKPQRSKQSDDSSLHFNNFSVELNHLNSAHRVLKSTNRVRLLLYKVNLYHSSAILNDWVWLKIWLIYSLDLEQNSDSFCCCVYQFKSASVPRQVIGVNRRNQRVAVRFLFLSFNPSIFVFPFDRSTKK